MTGNQIQERLIILEIGDRALPVFSAGPEDNGSHPGLIIIHEIFGLNSHIKSVARRFAAQNLRVFAPDLFANHPDLPADRADLDAMRKVWQTIPDSRLISDLQSVLHLAESTPGVQSDNIGTLGYCMGGAIALMFACSTEKISWVIDYYGRIVYPQTSLNKSKHPIDYVETLKCPLLGIFAGKDELITADHIAMLEERLKKQEQQFHIQVYEDAPHAFFNDEREHYHPDAAKDAWALTLNFIAQQN